MLAKHWWCHGCREYYKRLVNIGRSGTARILNRDAPADQGAMEATEQIRSLAKGSDDLLARQIRDEEEREAIAKIILLRTQRTGLPSSPATFGDRQLLGQKYSRQGMDRAASGAQYRDMTNNVIVTGAQFGGTTQPA